MDVIQLALVHYFDGNIWEWNPSIRPQDIDTFELMSSKPCEVVKIDYYQLPIGMKEINDSKHRGLRFYKEGSGNFFSLKNTMVIVLYLLVIIGMRSIPSKNIRCQELKKKIFYV